MIRSACKFVRSGQALANPGFFAPDTAGVPWRDPPGYGLGSLVWHPGKGWELCPEIPGAARHLFELYLPICGLDPGETHAIGHLGQSLDGCIATRSGDSCYLSGTENIVHLHRMRALCDAVLVGAETVAADNPQLTTRLVSGENPVRVVLDPNRRLHSQYEVFRDGAASTLLVCNRDLAGEERACHGQAEVLGVGCNGSRLDLAELLQRLRKRGLCVSFVEGGGVTVSAFLEAGLLDRLQIAVAPVVIGDGRPGLQLPPTATISDCLRPRCRIFRMGEDILFDCEPASDVRRSEETMSPAGIELVR